MRNSRFLPGVALALALSGAGSMLGPPVFGTSEMSHGFKTREARPLTLALLPPHSSCFKSKAVMSEQMVAECQALEQAGAAEIVRLLERQGYTVRAVTVEEAQADPALGELIVRVNERYNEARGRLGGYSKKIRRGEALVSQEVRELCARLDVEGLIISRIQAAAATKGKSWLMGVLSLGRYIPRGYAGHDIGVLHGRTTAIEAVFFGYVGAGLKALTTKPDRVMAEATRASLLDFPDPDQELKVRKKKRKSRKKRKKKKGQEVAEAPPPAPEPAAAKTEEEIVSELEALVERPAEEETAEEAPLPESEEPAAEPEGAEAADGEEQTSGPPAPTENDDEETEDQEAEP